MMKMTAKLFGVLCAASLVFCAACDNLPGNIGGGKDDDEDKKDVEVAYDVGSIVEFDGKDYLVTKNTEGAMTTELTTVQSTDLGTYYPNERADAYRKKLLADYGVTAYVELFDITEDKEVSPGSGDSVLYDTYMILQNRKGVYRIKQRRIAKDLFSGDDAETRSKPFEEKTNDELRQNYAPNLIIITNTLFETNLAKKFQEEHNFIYAGDKDADKQTLTYSESELDYVFKRLNYAKINGSERNVYGFRDRKAVAGKRVNAERCWELNHHNANSRFFEFNMVADGSYRLVAYGEGTVDGGASDTVYRNTLTIKGVQYDSSGNLDLRYDVVIKKNGNTVSKKVLPEGFDDNFVIKSSKMVSVEGANFDVPETITFFVPFFDDKFVVNHNAVLNKYTKVTFIPEPKNGAVIYVPKTDSTYPYEFIAQFVKDYPTLFKKESTPQPDVTLRPDDDVASDKTTPRFTFSGDSLKIELEAMATTEFDITADSGASKGKAGKLVDENSRAEAIITFPAGKYEGYAVIRAPSDKNDAFYVKFGDNYIRMYADDPLPTGYARTSRTPINLSCSEEMTVRMTIQQNSPEKNGETGMFIDYVEFTKTGSQGSDVPSANSGKADWTGFTMVDSADKLDFTVGAYGYKEVCYAEYEDTSMLETRIAVIEIVSSDKVTFAYKLKTEEYYDDASYNKAKEAIEGNSKYSYDDSTRTITKTYSEEDTMTLGELKDNFSFPEDAIDGNRSWEYTDKKLGSKNGVIQTSYTETRTWVDGTTKDTAIYYVTVTLTPQQ